MTARIVFTERERFKMNGLCPGPLDYFPAPGEVSSDGSTICRACGKRVHVHPRKIANHKPAAQARPSGAKGGER